MKIQVLAVTIAVTSGIFSSLALGAVTVIDSFTSEAFDFSLDADSESRIVKRSHAVESPFGLKRGAGLAIRGAPGDAVIGASLDAETESMSYAAEQTIVPGRSASLYFRLDYYGGGPHTLAPFTMLELDFAEVLGSGLLVVEAGLSGASRVFSNRHLVVEAEGVLRVPLDQVNPLSSGGVESFETLTFTFLNTSDVFSFTLNEIRAVPEPSTALRMLVGAGALLRRRRMR